MIRITVLYLTTKDVPYLKSAKYRTVKKNSYHPISNQLSQRECFLYLVHITRQSQSTGYGEFRVRNLP